MTALLAMELMSSAIAAAAAVAVSLIGLVGIGYKQLADRLTTLEVGLQRQQRINRDLWLYCRNLIDMYYRNRKPDAPDPDPLPQEAE